MERSGRARRLTGSPRAQPVNGALPCGSCRVGERVGARRPSALILGALIGRPLRLLCMQVMVAQGSRGCPSPEPGPNWRTRAVQPRLCGGRYEGTKTFLGRRGHPERLAAIAAATATAPQEVCGADTCSLHWPWDMKSAHGTRRRLRSIKDHDKKWKDFRSEGKSVS